MKMNDELIGMMECWNIGRLGLEDLGNGILDKGKKNGAAKKETGQEH
jgi:hypothetical protein